MSRYELFHNALSVNHNEKPKEDHSELPKVTSDDNGKVLTVAEGAWTKANAPTELPAVTAVDNGDVLTVVEGAWTKAAPSGGNTSSFNLYLCFDGLISNPFFFVPKDCKLSDIYADACDGKEITFKIDMAYTPWVLSNYAGVYDHNTITIKPTVSVGGWDDFALYDVHFLFEMPVAIGDSDYYYDTENYPFVQSDSFNTTRFKLYLFTDSDGDASLFPLKLSTQYVTGPYNIPDDSAASVSEASDGTLSITGSNLNPWNTTV